MLIGKKSYIYTYVNEQETKVIIYGLNLQLVPEQDFNLICNMWIYGYV